MSSTVPHDMKLADGSVIVSLHDGVLNASADYVIDPSGEEATAALRAHYADGLSITVNAFLLRRDGGPILIDAGCGGAYGPTLGRVPSVLASLGIDPADIRTVVLTHPHGDHIGGLFDEGGDGLRYPRAEVFCPKVDIDAFGGPATEGENPNRAPARKLFGLLGGKLRPYAPGEVLPGIEAISLPGHTPGHSGLIIGGEVLIWADVMHLIERQPANPDIHMVFDEDPKLAAATRRQAMTMAAEKGWVVGGMHLPGSGLARVTADGGIFRMESI